MHTQCPKCRTIFNVTEQILAVKAGLVRCGDCENVFNATWNLVDEADEFEEAPAPPPRRTVTVRPRRDDEPAGTDFPLPPREAVAEEPWPTTTAGDEYDDARDDDASWTNDVHGMADDGEDWPAADSGPDDDDTGPHDVKAHAGAASGDDEANARHARAFGPLERHPGVDAPDDELTGYEPDTGEGVDADDVLDGSEDEDISDEEIRRTLRLDRAFDDDDDDDDNEGHDDEQYEQDEQDEHVPGREREAPDMNTPGEKRSADRSAPSGGRIEPRLDAPGSGGLSVNADDGLLPRRPPQKPAARSPLRRKPAIQLKAPAAPARPAPAPAGRHAHQERVDPNVHWVSIPDNDRRGAQFLWASGVLLAIVLVALQVRFLLVDELYAIEGTRPYISLFCDFAGCSAPQRTDPGAIDIAQTRVDLHPEVPGAIRINVNLINRAAFAQPYPALELTLSDKDGRIVGRRTYQPADYLGERPDTALLDPGILAVAAINLAHPNENAVGFETRVVSGTPQ